MARERETSGKKRGGGRQIGMDDFLLIWNTLDDGRLPHIRSHLADPPFHAVERAMRLFV